LRCLITGGAGFIGSNLARVLLARGFDVRILDDLSTGRESNLDGVDCEFVRGDLRDAATVDKAVAGCSRVFHLGALPSVPRSIADPVRSNEVNVLGTLNVLEASRRFGVGRVIFASSSSIYGDQPVAVKSEDLAPRPMSPYAVSKLAAEKYCQVFYGVYGLETVCLRYFNVFGPRQDPDSPYAAVIPIFTRRILEGLPPLINGDGCQSRDFTFVENVVEGNLRAAEAPGAAGMVMNVACGGSISVNRLAGEIARLLGREDLVPVHAPARPGDVRDSMADIGLARRVLGYEPIVTFEEGLRRTVGFMAGDTVPV
jgi:UDP-glucose 4-epimerase